MILTFLCKLVVYALETGSKQIFLSWLLQENLELNSALLASAVAATAGSS